VDESLDALDARGHGAETNGAVDNARAASTLASQRRMETSEERGPIA